MANQILGIGSAVRDLHDGLNHGQLNVEGFRVFEVLKSEVIDEFEAELFLVVEGGVGGREEQQAEVEMDY